MPRESEFSELVVSSLGAISRCREVTAPGLQQQVISLAVAAEERLELAIDEATEYELADVLGALFHEKDGLLAIADQSRDASMGSDSSVEGLRLKLVKLAENVVKQSSSPLDTQICKRLCDRAISIYMNERKSSIRAEALMFISALLIDENYRFKDHDEDEQQEKSNRFEHDAVPDHAFQVLQADVLRGAVWDLHAQLLVSAIYRLLGNLILQHKAILSSPRLKELSREFIENIREQSTRINRNDFQMMRTEGAIYGLNGVLRMLDEKKRRAISITVTPMLRELIELDPGTRYGVHKAVMHFLAQNMEFVIDDFMHEALAGEMGNQSRKSDGRCIAEKVIDACKHMNHDLRFQALQALREISRAVNKWLAQKPDSVSAHPLYQNLLDEVLKLLSYKERNEQHLRPSQALAIAIAILGNLSPMISRLSGSNVIKQILNQLLREHSSSLQYRSEMQSWTLERPDYVKVEDQSIQLLQGVSSLLSGIPSSEVDSDVLLFIERALTNFFLDLIEMDRRKRRKGCFSIGRLLSAIWKCGPNTSLSSIEEHLVSISVIEPLKYLDSKGKTVLLVERFKEFWGALLGAEEQRAYFLPLAHRKNLFGKLVKTLVNLIREADHPASPETKEVRDSGVEVDNENSDQGTEHEQKKLSQMEVLLQLFCGLLDVSRQDAAVDWISFMLQEGSMLVSRLPYISKGYMFIGRCLRVARAEEVKMQSSTLSTAANIARVLQVAASALEYQDMELSGAILQMILELPQDVIQDRTDLVAHTLTSALELGLYRKEVALRAMVAVGRWLQVKKKLFEGYIEELVIAILPYVPEGASLTLDGKLDVAEPRILGEEKFLWSLGKKHLGRLALYIIGSLGSKAVTYAEHLLIEEKESAVHWELGRLEVPESYFYILSEADGKVPMRRKDGRGAAVPLLFRDTLQQASEEPLLHMVYLLPTLVRLTKSTNRQKKVFACELLHAVTVKLVGESVPARQDEQMRAEIFGKLMPVLLELAVDPDPGIFALINPLMRQLIHFMCRAETRTVESEILLDCIVVAATDESKLTSSRTKLTTALLGEYLRWALKAVPEEIEDAHELEKSGIEIVMRRLISLAGHPSNVMRNVAVSALWSSRHLFAASAEVIRTYAVDLLRTCLASMRFMEVDDAETEGSTGSLRTVRLFHFLNNSVMQNTRPFSRWADDDADLREYLAHLVRMCFAAESLLQHLEALWALNLLLRTNNNERDWMMENTSFFLGEYRALRSHLTGTKSEPPLRLHVAMVNMTAWSVEINSEAMLISEIEEEIRKSFDVVANYCSTFAKPLGDSLHQALATLFRKLLSNCWNLLRASETAVAIIRRSITALFDLTELSNESTRGLELRTRDALRASFRGIRNKNSALLSDAVLETVRSCIATTLKGDSGDTYDSHRIAEWFIQCPVELHRDRLIDVFRILADSSFLPDQPSIAKGLLYAAVNSWRISRPDANEKEIVMPWMFRKASKLLTTAFELALRLEDVDEAFREQGSTEEQNLFYQAHANILQKQLSLNLGGHVDHLLQGLREGSISLSSYPKTTSAKQLLGAMTQLLMSGKRESSDQICTKIVEILPAESELQYMATSDILYWFSLLTAVISVGGSPTVAYGDADQNSSKLVNIIVGYGLSRQTRVSSGSENSSQNMDVRLAAFDCLPLLLGEHPTELCNVVGRKLREIFSEELPSSLDSLRPEEKKIYDLVVLRLLSSFKNSTLGALVVAPLLVRIVAQGDGHHLQKEVEESLEEMAFRSSGEAIIQVYKQVFGMAYGENAQTSYRLGALKVCSLLVKNASDVDSVLSIANSQIGVLVDECELILSEKAASFGNDQLISQYGMSAGAVNLLSEIISRLPVLAIRGYLNKAFLDQKVSRTPLTTAQSTGSEFVKHVLTLGDKIGKVRGWPTGVARDGPALQEQRTNYCCAGYKLAATIILKVLGNQPKYLSSLLHPDFMKNIVDTQSDWSSSFTVETSFRHQRGILQKLRKPGATESSKKLKYLSTQLLIGSSSQGISSVLNSMETFDKNGGTGSENLTSSEKRSSNLSKEAADDEGMELDIVNRSICMPIVLRLISSLVDLASAEGAETKWYEQHVNTPIARLTELISNPDGLHKHVKAFLCRAFVKKFDSFRTSTQKLIVQAAIKVAADGNLYGSGIHYFTRDLCLTILGARREFDVGDKVFQDSSKDLIRLTEELMKHILVFNLSSPMWKSIMVSNVNMVKEFMECFHDIIPLRLELNIVRAYFTYQESGNGRMTIAAGGNLSKCREVGLSLVYAALANGVEIVDVKRTTRYIFELMTSPDASSRLYDAAAQVLGRILAEFSPNEAKQPKDINFCTEVQELSESCLSQVKTEYGVTRWITTMDMVTSECPSIARSSVQGLCDALDQKRRGKLNISTLRVLLRLVKSESAISGKVLSSIIPFSSEVTSGFDIDEVAVGLISVLGCCFPNAFETAPESMSTVLGEVCDRESSSFLSHPSLPVRTEFFRMLSDTASKTKNLPKPLEDLMEAALLVGLNDESIECRTIVLRYFHRTLHRDCNSRIADMLTKTNSQGTGFGTGCVQHSVNLVLQLCIESKRVDEPMHEGIAGATFDARDNAFTPFSRLSDSDIRNGVGMLPFQSAEMTLSVTDPLDRIYDVSKSQSALPTMESLTQAAMLRSETSGRRTTSYDRASNNGYSKANKGTTLEPVRFSSQYHDVPVYVRFKTRAANRRRRKEDEETQRKLMWESQVENLRFTRTYRKGIFPDLAITPRDFYEPMMTLSMIDVEFSVCLFQLLFRVCLLSEEDLSVREAIGKTLLSSFRKNLEWYRGTGDSILLSALSSALAVCKDALATMSTSEFHDFAWQTGRIHEGLLCLESFLHAQESSEQRAMPGEARVKRRRLTEDDSYYPERLLCTLGELHMFHTNPNLLREKVNSELKLATAHRRSVLRAELLSSAEKLSKWTDIEEDDLYKFASIDNSYASRTVFRVTASSVLEARALAMLRRFKIEEDNEFWRWCTRITSAVDSEAIQSHLESYPVARLLATIVMTKDFTATRGAVDSCLGDLVKRVMTFQDSAHEVFNVDGPFANIHLLTEATNTLMRSKNNQSSIYTAAANLWDGDEYMTYDLSQFEWKGYIAWRGFLSLRAHTLQQGDGSSLRIREGIINVLSRASYSLQFQGSDDDAEHLLRTARKLVSQWDLDVSPQLQEKLIRLVVSRSDALAVEDAEGSRRMMERALKSAMEVSIGAEDHELRILKGDVAMKALERPISDFSAVVSSDEPVDFNQVAEEAYSIAAKSEQMETRMKARTRLARLYQLQREKLKDNSALAERASARRMECWLQVIAEGGDKSEQMMPQLLHELSESSSAVREAFEKGAKAISVDALSAWSQHLVTLFFNARVDGNIEPSISSTIFDSILRIADTNPQSLCFSFRVAAQAQKRRMTTRSDEWQQLKDQIETRLGVHWELINTFAAHLELLIDPTVVFRGLVTDVVKAARTGSFLEKLESPIRRIVDMAISGSIAMEGSIHEKFRTKLLIELTGFARAKELLITGVENLSSALIEWITENRDEQVQRSIEFAGHFKVLLESGIRSGLVPLKRYSKWLAGYPGGRGDLGAHIGTGLRLPGSKVVQNTPSIIFIEPMPKVLSLVCDDQKRYTFLVKGGEDLRWDQHVQRIFRAMNPVLKSCIYEDHAPSNQALRTFDVIPTGLECGIVEWIPNTQSLKHMLEEPIVRSDRGSSLDTGGADKSFFVKAARMHMFTILNCQVPPTEDEAYPQYSLKIPSTHDYRVSLTELKRDAALESMNRQRSNVNSHMLQELVLRMACNPRVFIALRSRLMKSLVVNSVAIYILGIGDRHLDNILYDADKRCFTFVDFSCSLGMSSRLPVLELVPFRLDFQSQHLLYPMNTVEVFTKLLAACLKGLRDNRDVIFADSCTFAMDVLGENDSQLVTQAIAWKLEGRSPVEVLKYEISNLNSAAASETLHDIISGDPANAKRREFVAGEILSPNIQAQHLVELATDPNILARAYYGWMPWL